MKRCPECHGIYSDNALRFCRIDGVELVGDADHSEDSETTVDLSEYANRRLAVDELATRRSLDTAIQIAERVPSIAVLAFVNISADPENDYFCDGLAEELLNALAKTDGLKVSARTSAFSFKGKDARIREIGRALNVDTVLEGSVRRSGTRLRITAQLINVEDEYHLWSERYDRNMEDIFNIQDEITSTIVDALKVTLLGAAKTRRLQRHT